MSSKKQNKKLSSIELESKLKETEEKMDSTVNDLKRLQAEFENHIKRSDKEKENISLSSKQELIKELLLISDNFETAIKSIKETKEKEGINMIFTQLLKLFEKEGIKPINSVGNFYDPYLHDVIKKMDSDKEEGMIIEELQKGYSFQDNTLRPAKVIVSGRKKEVDNNTNSEDIK